MATPGERRALMFLVAVALLGAGTRAVRSKRAPVPNAALDEQIIAVDSAKARPRSTGRGRQKQPPANPLPPVPVDLDTAGAAEIEKLPGIGPSLAKRIVTDREANGPFGCLTGLDRVKGIGPALLARIDSLATFSYTGRPGCNR